MRDNAKGGALTEVTFFILLALHQPRHGYAVMQFVEERTGGRLALGAGTQAGKRSSSSPAWAGRRRPASWRGSGN